MKQWLIDFFYIKYVLYISFLKKCFNLKCDIGTWKKIKPLRRKLHYSCKRTCQYWRTWMFHARENADFREPVLLATKSPCRGKAPGKFIRALLGPSEKSAKWKNTYGDKVNCFASCMTNANIWYKIYVILLWKSEDLWIFGFSVWSYHHYYILTFIIINKRS